MMSSNRSKAGSSTSATSNSIDVSQHPGFVNLGNTCFLNSALQAISATQSLKHLYQPTEDEIQQQQEHVLQKLQLQVAQASLTPAELTPATTPGPSSRRESVVSDLVSARCKSPVLRLADEEHGRVWGQAISRPGSTSIEASSIRALASQAVCNPTPADIQSIQQSRRNSIENGKQKYEPQSKDIPLNTAFRQVMERSWDPANRRNSASKTFIKPSKVASINPKSLLNEISSKYDQYGEYRQQDGHELLRHLLDSLRMEELDVIKKIQPPENGGKRRKSISSQSQASQSPYITQNSGSVDEHDESLKPLVDNLFCGKLLSFVVCEGCRHVSHTYEDFYDISLSLRPDIDAKESGKRQRIRSMADRWRRSTSSKANVSSKEEVSKPLADSLAMLLDGHSGSYSDTEQGDDPIKRSNSRIGRGISRPRSTADRARIDANSKEGAKTFIKKQMEDQQAEQSDAEVGPEKAMEKLSIDSPIERKRESVSLLRAVSGRRTPASRASSPLRKDTVDSDLKRSSSPGIRNGDRENDNEASQLHRHHLHFGGHHKKKVTSKHAKYLSSLLTEAAPQPQQANLGALFWGRSRTPTVNDLSSDQKGATSEDLIAQQAGTGLIKALHQFTSVEVLDGSNSFACKRCWRLLNPPSAEEDQKLRLRRLRRGKGEHDSEKSSDDESSSDEEAKEERQKAALKSSIKSSTNGSSASSIASISDAPLTESSIEKSVESLVQGENGTSESPSTMQSMNGSTPSVVISTEPQTGSETPTRSTSMIFTPPQPKREATLKASQLTAINSSSETPKLQAPKPIMASLRLGKALSSTSSDEGGGSNQPSSDESSDEESNAQTPSEAGSRKRSIKYADEGGMSSITKPAPIATKQLALRRKRSIHSLQRRALKRFLIAETPKVLVFHFKRFQATGRGFGFSTSFKKIDDYVSFPEYLDVKPWLAPPREEYDRHGKLKASSDPRAILKAQQEAEAEGSQRNHHHHHWGWRPHHHSQENKAEILAYQPKTKYRLYAVVVHQGSMSGGHYTAYVLSDRASESLKAKADAHVNNTTESPKASKTSEKSAKKGNGISSNTSANDEGSVTTASTPSPLAANGIGTGSNSRIDSLSSVSSLEENIEQEEGEKETNRTIQSTATQTTPSAIKTDERRWIYASDTLVKPASIEEVLKAQAYMLFYEQL